jgi:hypothetical protein
MINRFKFWADMTEETVINCWPTECLIPNQILFVISMYFLHFWPMFAMFSYMPCKTSETPKLVEIISVNPRSLSLVWFLYRNWRYKICNKDHQQAPPHLLRDKSNMSITSRNIQLYMKVILIHSLHKRDMWHWLTCFLGLLKGGTILETKLSSQFHILGT